MRLDLGIQGLREGSMVEHALLAAGVWPNKTGPHPPEGYGLVYAMTGDDGEEHLFADVPGGADLGAAADVAAAATDPSPVEVTEVERLIDALEGELGAAVTARIRSAYESAPTTRQR